MLPEYLFDNVTEYLDFLSRYDPDVLDNGDKDSLITFAIVFLTPGFVNNPFLKAKLVTVSHLPKALPDAADYLARIMAHGTLAQRSTIRSAQCQRSVHAVPDANADTILHR